MKSRIFSVMLLLVMSWARGAVGQSPLSAAVAGDWAGALSAGGSQLPLVVHLRAATAGGWTATLDSPAQGVAGIPGEGAKLDGTHFTVEFPSLHGSFTATLRDDGKTLDGTWSQGKPMPLVLRRTYSAAELATVHPSPVDGDWLGELKAGGQTLRIGLHLHAAPGGAIVGTFDSLDQGANGLALAKVQIKDNQLSFELPSVHGSYTGTLSADGNELTGTWDQGAPMPLKFQRTLAKGFTATAPEAARPPVPPEELQAALAADLKPILAEHAETALVVGLLDHGHRMVIALGAATPDSIFEIGSVTKTFTGLALAQLVTQRKAALDEPVRALLPAGTVAAPSSGAEITLLDLATQHSGLPRLPDNLRPANPADPYADYRSTDLYKFLARQGVARPGKTDFSYSNLGFGLLGHALAVRAGMSYEDLIRTEIAEPMGLKDTGVTLSAAQDARFAKGHQGSWDPAQPWHFDALAGAGALHSTAGDLLTYCEAQLHPEKLAPGATGTAGATLPAAIALSHEPRADGPGPYRIGLAWLFLPEVGSYFHNGGTGGYNSSVTFYPQTDRAIVVLYNRMDAAGGDNLFADRVASRVAALLEGKPAPRL